MSKLFSPVLKKQMHSCSMPIASVKSLERIAQKLWKKLITQTCHPIVAIPRKISEFGKDIILSNMIIFFILKRQLHIFCKSVIHLNSFKVIAQNLWKSWLY